MNHTRKLRDYFQNSNVLTTGWCGAWQCEAIRQWGDEEIDGLNMADMWEIYTNNTGICAERERNNFERIKKCME